MERQPRGRWEGDEGNNVMLAKKGILEGISLV
jgi:hypothetical protein